MDVELVVTTTPEEASATAALLLADAARAGGSIALSGGSTPRRAYELAAHAEPDWGRAELWLADERMVPFEDARSNALLVREMLLDRVTVGPATHFVHTELVPDEAALAYDQALRDASLELLLLGVGPDGHTASLFPRAPTLEERERLAVAAEPKLEPLVPRVTMTIPALASARSVVFLVSGEGKAEAVRRAFAEEPSPDTPASLVRSSAGTTTAILDRAAASLLD